MSAAVSFLTPDQDYRKETGENQSSLKHILKSPAHYQTAKNRQFTTTAAMEIGSALHCLSLEGQEEFDKRYVMRPDDVKLTTKAGKEWVAEQKDKTVLSSGDWDTIIGMDKALKRLSWFDAKEYGGEESYRKYNEVSIYWNDAEHDIPCKARLDRVIGLGEGEQGIVLDLKTTDSIEYAKFIRKTLDLGYDFQAAWYTRAAELAFGKPFIFVFVAIERNSPQPISIFEVDDVMMSEAVSKIDEALARLKRSTKTETWAPPEILHHCLTLPPWYVSPVPVDCYEGKELF
jgi:hypothetical protein